MKYLRLFLIGIAMMASAISHAQPIMRIFEMQVHPDKVAEFKRLGEHNIRQSVNTEPGVLGMYVMTD